MATTTASTTNQPALFNSPNAAGRSPERQADDVESVTTYPIARFLKSVATWVRSCFKNTGEDIVVMRDDMEPQPSVPEPTGGSSIGGIYSGSFPRSPMSERFGVTFFARHSCFGDLDKTARVVSWIHDTMEYKSSSDDDVECQGTSEEVKMSGIQEYGLLYDPSIPSPPSSLADEEHDHIQASVMLSTLIEQDDGCCLVNEAEVSHSRHRRFRLMKKIRRFWCLKRRVSAK